MAADDWTERLGLIEQEVGAHTNDWGTFLNLNIKRLDVSGRGFIEVAVTAPETLDATDITTTGITAQEEGFFHWIEFTGTPGITTAITVQAEEMGWNVINNTDSIINFTPAGGGTLFALAVGKAYTLVYVAADTAFTDVGAAAATAITSVGTLTSLTTSGDITSGGDVLSDTDSTDSIGSTGVRWLKGWFDSLTVGGDVGAATATITGEATALGFTGTLDGVLGGGTPAAATVTTLTASGDFTYDSIVQPKVKIIDIGDWNMDGVVTVAPTHGLTFANLRGAEILIRNDADNLYWPLTWDNGTIAGQWHFTSTQVSMSRTTGGTFDNTGYDSTSYNRGWVIITYV